MSEKPSGQTRPSANDRRQPIPLALAKGPHDYVPGQQEAPVVLANFNEMLKWVVNDVRSERVLPSNVSTCPPM